MVLLVEQLKKMRVHICQSAQPLFQNNVFVKYRLQGTFYWVKNGKNKPIKALKFK